MIEIEIERKFSPSKEQMDRLLEGATKVKNVTLVNTYYDTAEYKLTLKDWWLRKRNGAFELKISLNPDGNRTDDRYREVTDEAEIRGELSLPHTGDLEAILTERHFLPFCTYTTERKTFQKDGFTIDVDDVDYGSFQRHTMEIELLVSDPSMAEDAGARILAFALQHGLDTSSVQGKVSAYLERERPEHFAAMKNAGILAEG